MVQDTRYHDREDYWSHYTRGNGLAEDQINSIAFNRAGDIILGLQCKGINAAQAPHFSNWIHYQSPYYRNTEAIGRGLPSNQINSLAIASDNTLYVATACGLAISSANDVTKMTYRFLRGKTYLDKNTINQKFYGLNKRSKIIEKNKFWSILFTKDSIYKIFLWDDQILCLYRDGGFDLCLRSKIFRSNKRFYSTGSMFNYDLLPTIDAQVYICAYASGIYSVKIPIKVNNKRIPYERETDSGKPLTSAMLPSEAQTTNSELKTLKRMSKKTQLAPCYAVFLGEDWQTKGNWVGRYGSEYAIIAAASCPYDHIFKRSFDYRVDATIGANKRFASDLNGEDQIRSWFIWMHDKEDILYSPIVGARRQGVWDDHGETYPTYWDGPNLMLKGTSIYSRGI